jgi:DNA-binding NarL/FixJ family response regulator
VAGGAAFLSPTVARRVIRQLGTGGAGRMSSAARARAQVAELTPREREVLTLVGCGLSNAEIGHRLHVAEGTVKVFVSAVLRGLRVRNRVQAAIVAYEAGLVERG